MYHPMLTLAVAQTKFDDLQRELRDDDRRHARAAVAATGRSQPTLRRRVTAYVATRHRATYAHDASVR